jgi:hypothetical protein
MPQLYDWQSRQTVDASEEEATKLVAAGTHTLPQGQSLRVVSPDGRRGALSAEEAHQAFRAGYRLETAAEAEERRKQKEYGEGIGNEVRAGLEGGARGLTFGMSDAALTKMGVDKEGLRERAARNPVSSTVGEIGGVVIPFLIPEPTSTAGAAARMATALPRLAQRGSQALAGKIVKGAAARTIAGSAVEGAFYGAGQVVTEASLTDNPDLTASQVLGTVGLGAVLGGGASAAQKALGKTLRFGAEKAVTAIRPAQVAIEGRPGQKLLTGGADDVLAAAGGSGGGGRATTAAAAQAGKNADEAFLGIATEGLSDFAEQRAAKAAIGQNKRAFRILDARKGGVQQFGRDLLNEGVVTYKDTLETIAKKAGERKDFYGQQIGALWDGLGKVAPAHKLPRKSALLARLNPVVDKYLSSTSYDDRVIGRALKRELATLNEALPEQMSFAQLHTARKTLDSVAYRNQLSQSPKVESLRELRGVMEDYLEETADKMANSQAGKTFKDTYREVKRLYGNMKMASEFAEDRILGDTSNRFVSPSDYGMGFFTGGLGAAYSMMDGDPDPALVAAAWLVGAAGNKVMRKRYSAVMADVLNRLAQRAGGMSVRVASLADLERSAQQFSRKMDDAVDGALAAGKRGARAAGDAAGRAARNSGGAALTVAGLNLTDPGEKGREELSKYRGSARQKTFHSQVAALRQLSQDPALMARRIQESLGAVLETAPQTGMAMTAQAQAGVGFLLSKAPASPYDLGNDPLGRHSGRWQPDDTEITRFNRYVAAVADPGAFLSDMAAGRVNREGVEAIRTVYPALFQELQMRLVERIPEFQEALSYQQRGQLSILFSVALDPSFEPGFVAAMQASYAGENAEQAQQEQQSNSSGGGVVKTTQGGLGGLKTGERAETTVGRAMSR